MPEAADLANREYIEALTIGLSRSVSEFDLKKTTIVCLQALYNILEVGADYFNNMFVQKTENLDDILTRYCLNHKNKNIRESAEKLSDLIGGNEGDY